ncbi:DNA-3-methyladenine glycosylase 2 family protein [Myxococcota bacterium]|nr:DNA-3-methyladenine glycosylase 2 family protein [Myxococcota bacterium]
MNEAPALRRELPLPVPLDLRRTFGPLSQEPRGRHEGPVTWWATRTPDGPASLALQVEERPEGEVLVAASWGPGGTRALGEIEALCGLADPAEALHTEDPVVEEARRRGRGLRIGRTGRVFEALVHTVLGQRVTTADAMRSLRELTVRYGARAPGPGRLWLMPTARDLAPLDYAHFHPLGVERQRARILIGAARRGDWLEQVATLPRAEAYARLCSLDGVGPWTAPLVMASACGDADAVPVGDYHLPSTIAWHLARERTADDARMVALLRPFTGHRWRVIRLLMQLGARSPRRGPRTEVRDIRGQ